MPDRAHTVAIDPELQPGARNAIRDCLRLKTDERITIITDEITRDIAAALQCEVEGMRADFRAIDALSQRLVERARAAKRIKCRTPAGTDFVGEFSPALKWLKTSGIITPDKWGNLPGGEIFTSPMNSNGVFVVDGVV